MIRSPYEREVRSTEARVRGRRAKVRSTELGVRLESSLIRSPYEDKSASKGIRLKVACFYLFPSSPHPQLPHFRKNLKIPLDIHFPVWYYNFRA